MMSDDKVIDLVQNLKDVHKNKDHIIYELPSPRPEMLDYSEMEPTEREIDWKEVELFLAQLDPDQEQHTFQTFWDNKTQQKKLRKKYGKDIKKFNKVVHADYHNVSFRERMQYLNQGGIAICFTVNQTDFDGRQERNIVKIRVLVLDLDGASLKNYKRFPLRPHAIVETSPGHYHVYWFVKDFPLRFFSSAQEALAILCGGDTQITDLPRAMRLPGTFHNKDVERISRARLLFLRGGPRYSGRDILTILGIDTQQKPKSSSIIYEGTRNRTLFKRACRLRAQGMSQPQILRKITRLNQQKCRPPLPDSELESIAQSAQKYAPSKKRLRFKWARGRSRAALRLINRVLAQKKDIFQRFGVPVVIRNVIPPSVLGFMKGVKIPMIVTITPSYMESLIEKYIDFYVIRDGKERSIDCPSKLAKKFMELPPQDLKLRPVNLLLSCPTLCPDGSLLQKPGYDGATGIYLLLEEEWKTINPTPSEAEARAALKRLLKLLKHFPFVRKCHKSVIVAGILTAIVRHCFRQAPAFGSSAPMYASGKSLLMDIIALVLTGKRAPAYNVSGREEEMDKFLLSAMVCGINIISIDNFNSQAILKSEALSSLLTQEEKMGRLLVTNKIVIAPTNVTALINGNNLVISEDLTSRTLLAKIDAQKEHPERRKIELDLFEHIPAHRQEYVRDALTILLYHLQSKPIAPELFIFGRYEQWSHWVREALVRLGMEDPCKTLREATEEDPDRNEKANFLQSCHMAYAQHKFLLRDIVRDAANAAAGGILDETEEQKHKAIALRALQDVLLRVAKDKNGAISIVRLERWLKSFKGRIINGLKITSTKEKTMYGVKWRIISA